MLIPSFNRHLTPIERHQVRSLVLRDSIALLSLFLITVVLAVATYFLFNSYSEHRKDLAARWFRRGQQAMQAKSPMVAIEDYHSALLYAPPSAERQIEIALASALASAGRIQEATAYFNTLRDAEPGNGEINLQLARLAARSGNEEIAKQQYHAAIYGNWEGDGYLKRRDSRLELVRYLISRGRFDQARSELLVASGNAPSSDLQIQTMIAGLLVEARFPADALTIYRQLLSQHPDFPDALAGAAETTYTLGAYQASFKYLQRLIKTQDYAKRSSVSRQLDEDQLHRLGRIIVLDPSTSLPPSMLASRLINDREIARTRLHRCMQAQAGGCAGGQLGATTQPQNCNSAIPAQLQELSGSWDAEPQHLSAGDLIDDPSAEERERKLIDDTEKTTATLCGEPSGDDAILWRLATVPSMTDTALEPVHE